MLTRGFEFYLRVFNSISHELAGMYVKYSVYYITTSEKGLIYYVTIPT